jgi:23S rRNA (guanosine2251-2'-O)-methyltransferase
MTHRRTTDELLVTGLNPVRELLASAQPVERIWVRGAADGQLAAAAGARRVPVESVSPDVLARIAGGAVHQGVVARLPEYRYAELAAVSGASGSAVLVLDGIQDPQNLGAILRTARAAGVAGVVVPKDRAAGVTTAVASASAGHVFGVRLARVTNLGRACAALKEAGWWLVGLVAGADRSVSRSARVSSGRPWWSAVKEAGCGRSSGRAATSRRPFRWPPVSSHSTSRSPPASRSTR